MHHISIRRGKRPIPAIGPKRKKEAISPKNRSGMLGINGRFLLISWENTSISINSISNARLKKKSTSDALGNTLGSGRIHETIGIARSSNIAGIPVWKDYLPLRIVQNAILRSKIQEAPRFFSVWDQRNPTMNKTSRHIQREIQKVRRASITDHAGVLMGSTGPRSGGYSGCAAWRKPRPNT
jgi:hypothetical protein